MFDFAIISFSQPDVDLVLEGLFHTLFIAIGTIIFALPLGILLGVMRTSKIKLLSYPAALYIELIRSMPLVLYVVMIFLTISIEANMRGILTLTTFTAAYIAEIVRGGLNSVDYTQIRAAYSLGLKPFHVVMKIAVPQAVTRMIPALVNQFNVVIKDTSLISIGLLELTKAGKIISERQANFSLEVMLVIAAIYFILCFALSVFGHYLENRYAERFKRA